MQQQGKQIWTALQKASFQIGAASVFNRVGIFARGSKACCTSIRGLINGHENRNYASHVRPEFPEPFVQPFPIRENVLKKVNSLIKEKETVGSLTNPENFNFAIVHLGATQFKVAPGDEITTDKLEGCYVGAEIVLEKVLLAGGKEFTIVGTPLVDKSLVRVTAEVLEMGKTATKIVFKKKRRKGYKREKEYRHDTTLLKIKNVEIKPDIPV
eukprot:Nk52_evm48s914 gene=Nk52_evmTU48s914